MIDAPNYAEARSLCAGERFSDQPAAAGCSGVLLTDSIVATAAHCLGVMPDGSADCANNRYVLGFAQRDESTAIRMPASQVFGCKGVLKQVRSPEEAVCRYDSLWCATTANCRDLTMAAAQLFAARRGSIGRVPVEMPRQVSCPSMRWL